MSADIILQQKNLRCMQKVYSAFGDVTKGTVTTVSARAVGSSLLVFLPSPKMTKIS